MIPAEDYVLPSLPFRKMRDLSRRFKHLQPPPGWTKEQGCWVLGCGRALAPAHGMCWSHLQRVYHGKPVLVLFGARRHLLRFGPKPAPYHEQRIANMKYELATNWTPEPNTGCWLWLGRFYPGVGYPSLGSCHDPWGGYAHRAVLYFAGVTLERGQRKHVRHLCGQPLCVNPDHLVYGTAQENVDDRALHARLGLRPHRETKTPTYLSPEQINDVRVRLARGETQCSVAALFGVTTGTVNNLATGRTYSKLPFIVSRRKLAQEAA